MPSVTGWVFWRAVEGVEAVSASAATDGSACGALSQAAAQAAGTIAWIVSVDATVVRAHQHAAGTRTTDLSAGEPPDHALGRSRGGWGAKIHLACDAHQRPLSILITPGQTADSPMMVPVLEGISAARPKGGKPRTRPAWVLGDRAYSSRANRAYLRRKRIRAWFRQPQDHINHRKRRRHPTMAPLRTQTHPKAGLSHHRLPSRAGRMSVARAGQCSRGGTGSECS